MTHAHATCWHKLLCNPSSLFFFPLFCSITCFISRSLHPHSFFFLDLSLCLSLACIMQNAMASVILTVIAQYTYYLLKFPYKSHLKRIFFPFQFFSVSFILEVQIYIIYISWLQSHFCFLLSALTLCINESFPLFLLSALDFFLPFIPIYYMLCLISFYFTVSIFE